MIRASKKKEKKKKTAAAKLKNTSETKFKYQNSFDKLLLYCVWISFIYKRQ